MRNIQRAADGELNCGQGGGAGSYFELRIAAIFIIFVGSTLGAVFPILARRVTRFMVPVHVFEFAKYFGSGVIIATAFIHLLAPAITALGSPCLDPAWSNYPYALAIALVSIFALFIVELVAFRWGTAKLSQLGIVAHGHGHGHATSSTIAAPEPCNSDNYPPEKSSLPDLEAPPPPPTQIYMTESGMAKIIGIVILEFGVVLHSVLIGLTLAVDEDFKILFAVLVFHQTFEGLGVGSRLAYLSLPPGYDWVPMAGALLYGLTTPIGIAVGLGVRTTYNPGSATASLVSGVMDSVSAGILMYTGLVELIAHEFLFNKEMLTASNAKLSFSLGSMMLGCALMALLGRWA